jgi:TolB protein
MVRYLVLSLFCIYFLFPEIMAADLAGEFPVTTNIGNPALKGGFVYQKDMQNWILSGSGYNIWNKRDEFFFLSRPASGDFIFSANVMLLGAGTELHRKAGLMFRSSLDEDAVYVDVAVHGDGLTSIQYRSEKGGETREVASQVKSPGFVQLEKSGNTFILRISKEQTSLDEVASVQVSLGEQFHAGMFICSHNASVMEQARFSNVRLDIPAEAKGGEQAPPSPSRLEILDIETGNRKIIFTSEKHFEAPNWSRNGKFLVFNQDGKLVRFELKSGKTDQINTGIAVANNNDHGISFDGKMLAISNHLQENGRGNSIIFTVPVKGGNPERITAKGPSYWHGWSPDGKWLVYCAERNGNYDVYKISSAGGEEIRLTTAEGLDDGPEYSSDGKYVYFNSVRSGTMQIWRMAPDGSGQEQVTRDAFNNWFAHPSPDGKHIIFVSYFPEVSPGSHPRNHRVMIRMKSGEGGAVKSVAFLYGGQGTMNVPSWSPDSKKIAFVSYSY